MIEPNIKVKNTGRDQTDNGIVCEEFIVKYTKTAITINFIVFNIFFRTE